MQSDEIRIPMEDAPDLVQLAPGGSLVVVSDGVFESVNSSGEQFGVGRLKRHLHRLHGKPSAEIVDGLCTAVRSWQGPEDPLDDQTIVVVQRPPG